MAEYSQRDDSWRTAFQSPNVPQSQPVTVNPSSGNIVPSGDTSGLYAIYGRKNPHAARAERLRAMSGMDMGGRLGQLPGVAATFLAGKAENKSAEFEQDRQNKIDAMLARKEAWEKIQNDKEAQKQALDTFEKEIAPEAYKAFSSVYAETKDYNAASKAMADAANAKVTEKGLPIPMFKNITPFAKGEFAMIWDNAEGKAVQGMIDKNGNLGKKNAKGETVPADKNDMLFDSYAKLQDVKIREQKAGAQNLKDYDLASISSQLNSLRQLKANMVDLSPEENAQYDALNSEFNRRTGVKASPPPPPQPEPQAAPAGPGPMQMAARTVAEQLRPSNGGVSGAVSRMIGGQPQSASTQAQPAQGLIRRASGGRIALFDPNTKAFVKWE